MPALSDGRRLSLWMRRAMSTASIVSRLITASNAASHLLVVMPNHYTHALIPPQEHEGKPKFIVRSPCGPWAWECEAALKAVEKDRENSAGMLLYPCPFWFFDFPNHSLVDCVDRAEVLCRAEASTEGFDYGREVDAAAMLVALSHFEERRQDAITRELLTHVLATLTIIEAKRIIHTRDLRGEPFLYGHLFTCIISATQCAGTPYFDAVRTSREAAIAFADRAIAASNP